ncbi:lysine transporter LysE [Aureimonas sp. Leaf454]|uniref:LysE family translocator n=1 Tax=Aureimonas sp. Leaf454 TaxID=1736381 RepID=UPI0006F1E659|nr:LysE family translocator [Aureimonas sp. Leaf454]KQT44483.1 lysine transporter LysE [Aureimonas sp. Leaf454]
MTPSSLAAYSLALAIAAAIPGPGVIALVARSLGSGFRHGLAFLAGLVLGDLAYLAAACFGLVLVAEAFGEVFTLIRYGAAAYLAYLAIALWRSAGTVGQIEALASERIGRSFAAGFMVTLSNPKTIFFYLALLPTILDLSAIGLPDFAILVPVTALVLVVVLTPYAALAWRARTALRRPDMLARLNRCAAAILAGAAVWTVMRRV